MDQKRHDTKLPQTSMPKETVVDEAVNKEMYDSLERATTTATSLDAERDRGNISKTESNETPNEPSTLGTSSSGGPRRQDTMGETISQNSSENVFKQSNDPPLSRVNTLRSGEDSLKLKELIKMFTNFQQRVIDQENTKTIQAQEISSLKRRVKRLEKKRRLRTHRLKRFYKIGLSARVESSAKEQSLSEEDASKQGRNIANIDADVEITLVDETAEDQGRYDDQEMFDITTAGIEETVSTAALITTVHVTPDELTMAQALVEIKKSKPKGATTTTTTVTIPTPDSIRPKAKGVVMQVPSETPTKTTIPKSSKVQDKGKGILVKEPLKMKKKDQITFNEKEARRLQVEFDKQDKLAKEKAQLIEDENLVIVPVDFEVVEDKAMLRQESSLKRAGDELDQERSKKQKVKDDKESEELKRCLEIIPDDGDDVNIDATPLSIKTLIINFDREDLEILWSIVKTRFENVQPVDYMDSFLMHTLKTMFEHHVKDTVGRSQQGLSKVKSWKPFDSCAVHDKESLENPFNEIADNESDLELEATTDTELSSTKDIHPLAVREPPQNSNIRQLIRKECCVEVPEQQKHKMEDTMPELGKICQEKVFLCIHDDVNDLIESALDSKLLLINSNSQHLEKKEQEVKNVVDITPETESDEVTESNAENLSQILSKCDVTLEDEIESMTNHFLMKIPAEEFKIYSNPLCDEDEINSDKLDPHCFNVESDFGESLLNRDTFIDFSSKFDFSGELAHIKPEIPKFDFDFEEEIHLIENLLYDNSFLRPPKELNAKIAETIIESIPLPTPVQDGNSKQEEIDIVTETDDLLPPSDDNDDDYDPLLGEADLFLSDDSIPPGIDDPEGDIRFLDELLIDDSILSHESSDSNFADNPSISRPPSEPPDDNFDLEREDKGVIDSGCSRHITGNMSYFIDNEEIYGGYIAFGDTKTCDDACKTRMETIPRKDYILLRIWIADLLISQESKSSQDDGFQPLSDDGKKVDEDPRQEIECKDQEKKHNVNSTNIVNVVGTNEVNAVDDDEEADMNNMDTTIQVNPVPTTRIHKDHPPKPKNVIHALKDPSWIEAMQEELLQFKLQEVWTLMDLPYGKRAIGTKCVFQNKKDESDFMGYQMDVKSDFLYEKIEKEVYVCQPPGFEDHDFLNKVYKVEKALYGLHQAPRACQDKYVAEILKKYAFLEVKNASTPMETQKPLLKDEDGEKVDVHMYRSMIGSLMYLTSSRPDIMFVVCTCTRYQFNLKVSHLYVVKRIFRKSAKFIMKERCVKTERVIWIYVTPSHTKKIFGNMKRVGKGFSGRETPLFPTMMVQAQKEIEYVADEAVNEELDDSLERVVVMDIIKRTKSKQNQTKPNTKWKAWKSQKSTKVNKKSTLTKSKPTSHQVKEIQLQVIRRALLMLEILSRRFFLKLNISDHRKHQRGVEVPVSS
nr:hypothetical protein [Tanacetum cinerariifolium]